MTRDPLLAGRMGQLRSHGVTRDPELMTREPDGPWYYQQIELGFNYRLTDIQAALGVSQMQRIDGIVARRHELAERYRARLSGLPLTLPWQLPEGYSSYHLFVVRVDPARTGTTRRQVFDALRAAGIWVNVHYIPIYAHPYYQRLGCTGEGYPAAEAYYAEAISLPMFAGMTRQQQDRVIEALQGCFP